MSPQMWLSLALALGQILVAAVLIPSVKSLVALATRVVVLEEGKKNIEAEDTKTASELHELRDKVDGLQVTVAELKGGMTALASVIGGSFGEKKQ